MTERACAAVKALAPKSNSVIPLAIKFGAQVAMVAKLPALTLATTVALPAEGLIVSPDPMMELMSSKASSAA